MASNGPLEPSAEARVGAAQLRQLFVALVAEDFTENQALAIIGQMMWISSQASGTTND